MYMKTEDPKSLGGARAARKCIERLASGIGRERQSARRALVHMGNQATPLLVAALEDRRGRVRWEAAKALGAVRDPRSAAALVRALSDRAPGVRWLAAEGLIALGVDALPPLLHALEEDGEESALRNGAHHVLHALERDRKATGEIVALLDSLRSVEPELTVPAAARSALASLARPGAPRGRRSGRKE